jgi:ADP-ribose pyrophosphatase YjhB (NUDIX family)
MAGAWTLLGGRIEPGEDPETAVVREVREETGLAVRVLAPLGVIRLAREGYDYAIHELLCAREDPSAEPHAASDAADVRWAALRDLADLGVNPEAVAVVAVAASHPAVRRDTP